MSRRRQVTFCGRTMPNSDIRPQAIVDRGAFFDKVLPRGAGEDDPGVFLHRHKAHVGRVTASQMAAASAASFFAALLPPAVG